MKSSSQKICLVLYFGATIFYFFSQWLITVFVVRLSGYTDAGYLSLAMSTSSTFEIIALFRVRDFQISDYKSEYSNGEYVGSRIVTCLIALVLCIVFSLFGNEKMQFWCIVLFMLIRTAEALSDVFQGMEQQYDRYDYIALSFFLRGLGLSGIFYVLMYMNVGMQFVLLVISIWSFTVVLIFEWVRCGRIKPFKPVINKKVFALLTKCVPLMICSFLISFINLIPKVLLERFHGTESLGIYSSIASPTLIIQVMAGTVIYPIIPKMTERLQQDGFGGFIRLLHKLYFYMIGLTIVVFIGAKLLGRFGLRFLYGESILKDYAMFYPVVFCTIALAILRIFTQIMTVMRKIGLLTVVIVITSVLSIIISVPLVRMYGGNGASAAQIIACMIAVAILIVICEMTGRSKEPS